MPLAWCCGLCTPTSTLTLLRQRRTRPPRIGPVRVPTLHRQQRRQQSPAPRSYHSRADSTRPLRHDELGQQGGHPAEFGDGPLAQLLARCAERRLAGDNAPNTWLHPTSRRTTSTIHTGAIGRLSPRGIVTSHLSCHRPEPAMRSSSTPVPATRTARIATSPFLRQGGRWHCAVAIRRPLDHAHVGELPRGDQQPIQCGVFFWRRPLACLICRSNDHRWNRAPRRSPMTRAVEQMCLPAAR